MSIKSQEGHMRQLALLLTTDLGCIFGERESGPNGSKKAFLNVGKVFLRALAKDLGLHEVTVSANSGGIAVSGTCSLYGMWEDRGIAVWIEQRLCADGKVLCYRTIRSSRDFKGGYNHFLTSSDLKTWSYPQLLETLSALRKDGCRYGNLSQSEYDHLGTCREELRQSEAKIAALQTMTAAQLPDFDREIAQANASIAEIKRKMANVIAYISKRAELTFSQLKMNRVEISLYDVVKSTGEVKDTFKFQYGGRRYDRLSLSEKIRAGMEVSELMKRLTGRNYPVFVDNMESVDDLANVRPTGQIIMAKCVSGAALQVKPIRPIAFAEQRAA